MNTPLDTRCTICFGDDPDEIVTVVDQADTFEPVPAPALAQAAGQRMAVAWAMVLTACLLLGGTLWVTAPMAAGAAATGAAWAFAQAS